MLRGLAVQNGDDRSVKIESLEAAKIMKIKWLVLGCIETTLRNQILVGKLLARSIRFTCVLREKRTEIENELMKMYSFAPLRPQQFSKFSSQIL